MSTETETKTISREDYYKLLGLATLAREAKREMDSIESAMIGVLGLGDYSDGGYLVSDALYNENGPAVDSILSAGGFVVAE